MKKQVWSILILTMVILGIVLYLSAQSQLLTAFKQISFSTMVYLIGLRLLFLVTNGLFLRTYATKFDIRLTSKEWIGIPIVTTMGNYITPFSGGVLARATYLKHRHSLPYAQFATLLAANYLITFWVVGVVGVLTLLVFVNTTQFYWQIILFFSGVILAISLLIVLPTIRLPWHHRLVRILNTSLAGWNLIKTDKPLLVKLVLYTLVNILLNGFSFWVAYGALGFPISFAAALLIGLLAVFSLLFSITPGNLGIQEAAISLSSTILEAGTGPGLLVSLLIRAGTLVPVFILGPIFSYLLTRELTTHRPADKIEQKKQYL